MGSIRACLEELAQATAELPGRLAAPRRLSWVVGKVVAAALQPVVERLNRVEGLTLLLHGLPSPYWGQDQVVTGLLTGADLRAGLDGRDLGEALLLPRVMLREGEDVFLDDSSLADAHLIISRLQVEVGQGGLQAQIAQADQVLILGLLKLITGRGDLGRARGIDQ
ncbi:MAG: DUF512 domain-containing protein [Cyanobium sp.]